ncbi:unnamed protein product [Orchesella dallaii]|uniref:Acyltransferase n=1 Tax=Orchesella dallaii TaxID=48710 RepID=A0ABP1PY10_9HEXA
MTNSMSQVEKEGLDSNGNDGQTRRSSLKKSRKVFGVEFAPLDIPWERRMQTLAVTSWIATFFLMGPVSLVFLIYLLFYTRFWLISLLYLTWFIYDLDQCNKGGRSWQWVRHWKLWKRYCAYFPIRLVKTDELDPKRNYLFGIHPHGILCSGAFGNFATEGNDVKKVFPGIVPHLLTLEGHYLFPFYREYLMCSGSCSASKSSMNYLLSRPEGGHACVVVVGGAPESLDSHPGSYIVQLRKRKGFIKIALRHGASLVPIFSFGETDIYDQVANPEGSLLRRIQNKLQTVLGLAPCVFKGRGIFQYTWGLVPQRRPITTVVGSPIHLDKVENPTQEEIDVIHKKYVDSLIQLFYTHREKYADATAELTVL